MIKIGLIYWCDPHPAGAPSFVDLPAVPRIGETFAYEDVTGPDDQPKVRARYFVVCGVMHHVLDAGLGVAVPTVTLYLETKK